MFIIACVLEVFMSVWNTSGVLPNVRLPSTSASVRRSSLLRAFLLLALFLGVTGAFGEEAAWLYWDTPNTNQNVVAYQVFYGTNSGNYIYSDTSYYYNGDLIYNLEMGQTYYFTVAAVDVNGKVSDLSHELVYTVPKPISATAQTQLIPINAPNPTDMLMNYSWDVPCDWELEYSFDLQYWVPWQAGHGTTFSADADMAGWGDLVFFRVFLN
jgi:hypothetical protein